MKVTIIELIGIDRPGDQEADLRGIGRKRNRSTGRVDALPQLMITATTVTPIEEKADIDPVKCYEII